MKNLLVKKMLIHEQKIKKDLTEKVLENAGNLFNRLYYIYKIKYNKKINSLDTENKKKFDYKKIRLIDDYEYPSEEETSTKSDELKLPKWIKVNETRFNEILTTITEAKNNGLKANVDIRLMD